MKKQLKNILFISVIVVLSVFLIEGVLSIADPESVMVKSFDGDLLFSMYPNKSGMVVSKEYSVRVDTNKYGFRQKIYPNEKYATIILGDSFTEGWGVREDEIYVQRLNQKLPIQSKLLNLGLHGSSPVLYALQLPFYLKTYLPQNVIIQLFDNDLDDNQKLKRFIQFNSKGIPMYPKQDILVRTLGENINNFIKETSTYRLFKRMYKLAKNEPYPILYYKIGRSPKLEVLSHSESIRKYGGLQPLGKEINQKYNNQFGFYQDYESPFWQKLLMNNQNYLEYIVYTCKRYNVKVSFLYIPAKEFFAKGGITGNLTDTLEDKNTNNPHYQQILKICQKEDLECFYVNDLFYNQDPESLYFPHDAHLNPKGHLVLSKLLFKNLQKWVLEKNDLPETIEHEF